MAYDFVRTSNQWLSTTTMPITTWPLTTACWFRANNTTHTGGLISLYGNATNYFLLAIDGTTAGDPIVVADQSISGQGAVASTTAGFSANTWHHACGVRSSATSRTAYLDGGSAGSNTITTASPININQFSIGRFTSATHHLNGMIAEVGIWNAALSAAEIASLAKGMTCDKVRPQSLVFYAPLVRNLQDTKGGLTITNNGGATVATHPRVYA